MRSANANASETIADFDEKRQSYKAKIASLK
jgi:hypothetical protein